MMLQDFAIDVPVGDGTGTRADPTDIIVEDIRDVSRAAELFLSCVHLGRARHGRTHVYWRILERDLWIETEPHLLKIRVERIEVTQAEWTTEIASYFFRTPSLRLREVPAPYTCHADNRLKIVYPFKLATLEYAKYYNYDAEAPGRGYSIGYGAPEITATLYVLNAQPMPAPAHRAIPAELEAAVADLKKGFDGCRPVDGDPLPAGFSPDAAHAVFEWQELRTFVVIDHGGGRVLKWRITCANDERRQLAHEFLARSRALLPNPGLH
jgi:hypothetical protein